MMGWTSFNYTESTHLNFNSKKSYEFCRNEFQKNGYVIVKFWHQRAKNKYDNNVAYLVLKHPEGYNFILVILIFIENKEIYFKEIPASFGPAEYNCPVEFLSLVKIPETNSFEYDWFIKVRKNNLKFKKQF